MKKTQSCPLQRHDLSHIVSMIHTGYILTTALAIALVFTGCISDNNTGPLSDDLSGESMGINVIGGESSSDVAGSDIAGEEAGGENAGEAGEALGGRTPDPLSGDESGMDIIEAGSELGGETERDMSVGGEEPLPVDPPLPPEELPACDRFCQRVEDCLYPRCEALSGIPVDQFCQGWCRNTGDDWLDQGAELSCDDFTRRIYGFSPEIRTICEADPNVDGCEVICDFGEICGLVSGECLSNCRAAPENAQLCFRSAAETEDCQRFLSCYDQGPQRDPEEAYEEVCQAICIRESTCISNACAPGTWGSAEVEECLASCVAERATQEELFTRFERSCDEVVSDTLDADTTLAERCAAPEEEVCPLFCSDRVVGCGGLDQGECEELCTNWDEANFICLQSAGNCDEVDACLVPSDDQERCRRSCDHLQGCIEAACPPRIISPTLADTCTANCFANPISVDDLEQWEQTGCREVREVVYQDNPQLRPICEGNQDFRPSPEECSAFCDDTLDACVIGGPTICLSACAGLSREQYVCALEAQGDCGLIDSCLIE